MQILLTPLSVFLTCPIHYYQITECNFPGGAASQYTGLSARPPVCLPVCQFQLALSSGMTEERNPYQYRCPTEDNL